MVKLNIILYNITNNDQETDQETYQDITRHLVGKRNIN